MLKQVRCAARCVQVSAWVTQLIVNQGSHDDRKAILSCILRLLQTCWNIGNFNAVAEIINGLKSVTRCVAFIFVETAGRKQ